MRDAPTAHRIGELPQIGRAAVAMGVFDGVHLGHRAILVATAAAASDVAATPVALVFDPHPREVLDPGTRVVRLTDLGERSALIRELSVEPLVLAFDRALSALSPDEFLARLSPAIDVAALVMTPSSAFGRGRAGTLEWARKAGREGGFEVREVPTVEVDGEAVSSSRIRAALAAGDRALAERLLGRPVADDAAG